MRKVICGFLVAVLLLSVTVLISGTAFADQKNVSVSASIAQSDNKFSMSSSDKVNTFRYGKGAIGSFQISGNINEETTYQGVQAVGLESGTIAFKYNYSGAYLKDSDTSWSIIDDGSKEIDSIKLDASIKKGVLLVQKSYDGRTWVNAAPPVVNYFATIKAGNNQFYTADGSDIASGTFYRMSVSYNRLWKLMIDKRISKTELTHMAGISTNAMAKLGRDEDVRMVVLEKICAALNCKIEDIVEIQNGDRLILEEQREIR